MVNPAFPMVGEFGELYVERRLFLALFGGLSCHFSYFGGVAHPLHLHGAVSVGDGGSSHHAVGGVGGLVVEVGFVGGLVHHQFSGQARLVDLQRDGLHQLSVGRHFLAGVQYDDVAHDHVFSWNLVYFSVSDDGDGCFFSHLVEEVELLVGVVFKVESYARGEEDGEEYSDGFGILAFDDGDDEREYGSHQQDADDGVLEFLQVKFPYGRSFGWSQQVGSMLGTAFPYLFVGQSDVIIVLFHCVEIYPFCFVRKCTTIIWDARCD